MNLPYDACHILFLPDTPKQTLTVQPGRGVCFAHHWYWCDEMAASKVERKEIDAKYDPYDLSHIYLYIGKAWVKAEVRSGPLREILHTLTEWERKYISRELTGLSRKYRGAKQRKKVQAAYGAFIRKMRTQEEHQKTVLRSQANKINQLARQAKPKPHQEDLPATDTSSKPPARVDRSAIKSASIVKQTS
ncbi:MAG: Mu transposase C-terminal domain-containing protein [Coraliomargarita sp.]